MSNPQDKKPFHWENGDTLDADAGDAVEEVRRKGLPKISKAVHADPAARKENRDRFLKEKQAQPYSKTSSEEIDFHDDSVIAEETHSGLSQDFEKSDVKRLIDKGQPLRRAGLFGNRKKDKKDDNS